ncbi:MAG: hypothetical protein QOI10_1959 [Solirubrobacterales bacterium]|jgi:hypothetical protein|nr:hypothetical protein [Solirubrobacterales bacterium]
MDVYQRRRLVALSAIALIFIVFVLLIRSCGGDDQTTTATPLAGATGTGGATVLAVADYIAAADPICLQANTSLANVDETDPVQADNEKAQIVAGEVQQLQTLGQPADGTDKLNKFLSDLQKQATAYQDRSTAGDRGDDAAVAELDTTIDQTGTDVADAADAFGFKVCGDLTKVGDSSGGGGGGTTSTDTGGTATPTTTIAPATTTTPVPVAPPTDQGGTATPAPTPAPTDGGTGGTGSSSGGVSP